MANIIWMPSAKDTYAEILENLNLDATLLVDDQVEKLLNDLGKFTHLCPPSTKLSGIRRCIVNKQLSMTYTTDSKSVFLIAFYFNRSDVSF